MESQIASDSLLPVANIEFEPESRCSALRPTYDLGLHAGEVEWSLEVRLERLSVHCESIAFCTGEELGKAILTNYWQLIVQLLLIFLMDDFLIIVIIVVS